MRNQLHIYVGVERRSWKKEPINHGSSMGNDGKKGHAEILLGRSRSNGSVHPKSNRRKGVRTWVVFQVPNLKHLRVFGSIAYVYVLVEKWKKLDIKVEKCIIVGYSKGVQVLQPLDQIGVSDPRPNRRPSILDFCLQLPMTPYRLLKMRPVRPRWSGKKKKKKKKKISVL